MSTADYDARLPLDAQVPPRLLTSADLEMFPEELPTQVVRYELDNGRLLILAPATFNHGDIQVRIASELLIQGDKRGFGKARISSTVVLWQNPDRVVVPDVMFISNSAFPLRHSPEGYLKTIPTLVVEVRSQKDSQPYLERKISDYLQAGVAQVWIADPTVCTIAVHALNLPPRTFEESQVITDECLAAIPGLRLVLADIFRVD